MAAENRLGGVGVGERKVGRWVAEDHQKGGCDSLEGANLVVWEPVLSVGARRRWLSSVAGRSDRACWWVGHEGRGRERTPGWFPGVWPSNWAVWPLIEMGKMEEAVEMGTWTGQGFSAEGGQRQDGKESRSGMAFYFIGCLSGPPPRLPGSEQPLLVNHHSLLASPDMASESFSAQPWHKLCRLFPSQGHRESQESSPGFWLLWEGAPLSHLFAYREGHLFLICRKVPNEPFGILTLLSVLCWLVT